MSEQTVKILIRLLLRSSLIRIYTVCHSSYIYWRHYFIVKLNGFILRTTTVAGLGVPIFRVFTGYMYTATFYRLSLQSVTTLRSGLLLHTGDNFQVVIIIWSKTKNQHEMLKM